MSVGNPFGHRSDDSRLTGNGSFVKPVIVGLRGCFAVPSEIVEFGAKLNLGVQGLVHGHGFARVSSVTAEDGSQGAHGTVISLVIDVTLDQGIDEIELLLLVTADIFT